MVKSVKFIRIKGSRESRLPEIRPKKVCPGRRDLTVFENFPGGCPWGDDNAWN